jgi:thiosulfate/3-mercaptopyruvate sulfurtransferase
MAEQGTFMRIGHPQADALLQRSDVHVLDVRDAESYLRGHIEGAENISTRNLGDFINSGKRDAPVLVYCYHGNSSQEYAKILVQFGFSDVSSLDGGYEAWRNRPPAAATAPSDTVLDPALQQWLMEQGFGPDGLDGVIWNNTTPLMKASHMGDAAVVRQLIAAGARLDARNGDGGNALWLACVGNHPDMIDILVDAGIDIDNRNDNGATCLMYAASSGKPEVVGRLLARGADTKFETPEGFSALDLCSTLECLTLLRQATKARKSPHSSSTGTTSVSSHEDR